MSRVQCATDDGGREGYVPPGELAEMRQLAAAADRAGDLEVAGRLRRFAELAERGCGIGLAVTHFKRRDGSYWRKGDPFKATRDDAPAATTRASGSTRPTGGGIDPSLAAAVATMAEIKAIVGRAAAQRDVAQIDALLKGTNSRGRQPERGPTQYELHERLRKHFDPFKGFFDPA